MKTCTKCNCEKSLDEFDRDKSMKDGRRPSCKACKKAYRQANKEQIAEYYQVNRKKILETQKAYQKANKDKFNSYQRAYSRANQERIAEKGKAWRRDNPDKCRASKHRRRAREACAVPQRWKKSDCPETLCYWCGVDLSTVVVHLEHLMPISLGGEAKPYNEAPACKDCNIEKLDKHPLVWIASQF